MGNMVPQNQSRLIAAVLFAIALAIAPALLFSTAALGAGAAAIAAASASGESSPDSEVVIPPDLTPLEREALLARLSDEQVRGLVQGLLASTQAGGGEAGEKSLLETVELEAAEMRGNFGLLIAATPKIIGIVPFWVRELVPDDGGLGTFIVIVLFFAAVLAVGYGAEWLVRKATASAAEKLKQRSPESFTARLNVAFLRLGLDVLHLLTFSAAAVAAFFLSTRDIHPFV